MAEREAILARISEIVGRDLRDVEESTDLRDLVADSIMLIDLAIEVQESFDLALDHSDLRGVETLGDFVAMIQRRCHGGRAESPSGAAPELGREGDPEVSGRPPRCS